MIVNDREVRVRWSQLMDACYCQSLPKLGNICISLYCNQSLVSLSSTSSLSAMATLAGKQNVFPLP